MGSGVVNAIPMNLGGGSGTMTVDGPRPIVTRHSTLKVTGLSAHVVLDELLNRGDILTVDRSHLIVTPNMHHLAMLQRSDVLASAYADASMILPDGWPVVRLANALGARVERRLTGSDLVAWLAESDGTGRRIHIIGGSTPHALHAAESRFAAAGWEVGAEHAPIGWLNDPANLASLAADVDAANPDIVLVALGTPKQEVVAQWLRQGTNTSVFICVGAGVDFLSGDKHRAPLWMQRHGLEWLHRIVSEPGRLLRRYVEDVPPFVAVMRRSLRPGERL